MRRKLLLLSFIEGSAVMVAELCGARLLAPVFGSSLYVWASVMGITLGALAAGYFFGGSQSASGGDKEKKLFSILNVAALFLLLMPVLAHYLVPRISYLPFMPGVILSTLILLFGPVFLLGASSPLFIILQTNDTNNSGKVSGTVYAISTAGGIVATFLCGFCLIPLIGLNACLLIFGTILFVFNIMIFKKVLPFNIMLFVFIFYMNVNLNYPGDGTIYSSDGILGKLKVLEHHDEKGKVIRYLSINNIIQTEMELKSHTSVSEYIRLLDTLIPERKTQGSALVLGLGGGLTANLLLKKNYITEGVEFDARIIEAAKNFFFLDQKISTYEDDARTFLNGCKKKYDVILVDIFRAEEQPSHVLTIESLATLKNNLDTNSLLLINWHGYLKDKRGIGSAILKNTLEKAGYNVNLCATSDDEDYRNIVFVAGLENKTEFPFKISETNLHSDLINSDNQPLLEFYNADANKKWRTNYLRFYQSRF